MPCDAASMFSRTVDPVVVMPDTDSKIASVGLSANSQNMKGKEPKAPIRSQDPFVSRNACLRPKSKGSRCEVLNIRQRRQRQSKGQKRQIPASHPTRNTDLSPSGSAWLPPAWLSAGQGCLTQVLVAFFNRQRAWAWPDRNTDQGEDAKHLYGLSGEHQPHAFDSRCDQPSFVCSKNRLRRSLSD